MQREQHAEPLNVVEAKPGAPWFGMYGEFFFKKLDAHVRRISNVEERCLFLREMLTLFLRYLGRRDNKLKFLEERKRVALEKENKTLAAAAGFLLRHLREAHQDDLEAVEQLEQCIDYGLPLRYVDMQRHRCTMHYQPNGGS